MNPHLVKSLSSFPRDTELVAILNSHQSKRPCRTDPWVDSTLRAIQSLESNHHTLLSSIGLNTWELLVHLAGKNKVPQLILLPTLDENQVAEIAARVIRDFELKVEFTSFAYPSANDHDCNESSVKLNRLRDQAVISLADRIIPVSIDPKGKLSVLLAEDEHKPKLDSSYLTPYQGGKDKPVYSLEKQLLIPETIAALDECIVHWTRSCYHPYPGESAAAFYQKIVESCAYPHSALDTLKRIADQNHLHASNRFIRGGFNVVSFSASRVTEAIDLMRWRRRYVYFNFEPYGVAIEKSIARRIGIKPVVYGDKCDYDMLDERDRPYFQTASSDVADWTPEAEWRYSGNLDLSTLPDGSLTYVVYKSTEIREMRSITNCPVIPLFL
jgi:hypothetical protein